VPTPSTTPRSVYWPVCSDQRNAVSGFTGSPLLPMERKPQTTPLELMALTRQGLCDGVRSECRDHAERTQPPAQPCVRHMACAERPRVHPARLVCDSQRVHRRTCHALRSLPQPLCECTASPASRQEHSPCSLDVARSALTARCDRRDRETMERIRLAQESAASRETPR
jgi:hypothetical protein